MKKYLSIFVLVFVLVAGFSYVANETYAVPGVPECSDGIDNDGVGDIDDLDPDCHLDGNVANPASYDSSIWQELGAGLPCPTCVIAPIVTPPSGGGGGGGGCMPGAPCSLPAPTPAPVIAPVPQVLGATQIACGEATGRPCMLQKTGGLAKPDNTRLSTNRNANSVAGKEGNSLVIKKLGINKHILQLPTIDALFREAMISPGSPSTPDKGGNTVLVGHAYYSRNGSQSKSTFFELDTMKAGDEIEVTWKGVKYTYIVSEVKTVKPDQIEVEDQTTESILTIYSCGRYTNAIRNVVVAKLKV